MDKKKEWAIIQGMMVGDFNPKKTHDASPYEIVHNMTNGVFSQDDDHWVTINGTHVLIGEGGEIKGGPEGIKKHYEGKSGKSENKGQTDIFANARKFDSGAKMELANRASIESVAPKGKSLTDKDGNEYFVAKHFDNNTAYVLPAKYKDNPAEGIKKSAGLRMNPDQLKERFGTSKSSTKGDRISELESKKDISSAERNELIEHYKKKADEAGKRAAAAYSGGTMKEISAAIKERDDYWSKISILKASNK